MSNGFPDVSGILSGASNFLSDIGLPIDTGGLSSLFDVVKTGAGLYSTFANAKATTNQKRATTRGLQGASNFSDQSTLLGRLKDLARAGPGPGFLPGGAFQKKAEEEATFPFRKAAEMRSKAMPFQRHLITDPNTGAILSAENIFTRRRRLNPLNPRALRRAQSRMRSFEKFVLRNFRLLHKSKLKPKKRRK